MKNLFVILTLVLVSAFAVSAQSNVQTANEGFVGYSFVASDVKASFNGIERNRQADPHGVNAAYTRYFAGTGAAKTIGFTADLGANFNGKNDASLVTVMGGLTAKARNNKYVQPYVRVLGGVARQNVNYSNITKLDDVSAAYALGGGVDFNVKAYSRYKIRFGADYLNTGFNGQRDGGVRLTTGLTF